MEVHTMRPVPLRPAAAPAATQQPAQPVRYLTNDEAAVFLRLSPRTLEKQRVIGGGPRFRKFGRRVMYAVADPAHRKPPGPFGAPAVGNKGAAGEPGQPGHADGLRHVQSTSAASAGYA